MLPLVWYPYSVPPHRQVASHGLGRRLLPFVAIQCHAAVRLNDNKLKKYMNRCSLGVCGILDHVASHKKKNVFIFKHILITLVSDIKFPSAFVVIRPFDP